MKLRDHFKLTFITPCFCAGANQKVAEIRPTAIRAELRWWFRCLGGNRDQESAVFGSAAGSQGKASSILVRVSEIHLSQDGYHIPGFLRINDQGSYLHYFLTAPNKNLNEQSRMWELPPNRDTERTGAIRKESQIPPNSSFSLQIYQTRQFPSHLRNELENLLRDAIQCFKLFGSIGFRKTRGFGAWISDDLSLQRNELVTILDSIKEKGFSYSLGNPTPKERIFNQIEARLKGNEKNQTGFRLKSRYPAKFPSPMGHSDNASRQSSAVYFRPVTLVTRRNDIQYVLLVFQAPDSILGDQTKDHLGENQTRADLK